jgi:hypothetical protein
VGIIYAFDATFLDLAASAVVEGQMLKGKSLSAVSIRNAGYASASIPHAALIASAIRRSSGDTAVKL